MLRELVISLAGLAAACASTSGEAVPLDLDPNTVSIPSPPPAVVDRANTILRGYGPLESKPEWRVGDRAVYVVHLQSEGEEQSWILELEVSAVSPLPPDGSGRRVTYRTSVYDEYGSHLEISTSELDASDFLGANSGYAAGALAWSSREGPVRHYRSFGAQRIFRIILGNTALEPVIREVVDPPSMLEVIRGGGLGLTSYGTSHPPRPIPLAGHEPSPECYPHELEISWFPNALEVERQALVKVTPWFCDPKPPFHVGIGLVTMWIQHPTDAGRRTWIHLVAARRASAPRP